MRPASACLSCREGKRKCRQEGDESACVRCQALHISCSFSRSASASKRSHEPNNSDNLRPYAPFGQPTPPYDDSPPQSEPTFDACVVRDMVQCYFRVIHDKHHSIFHRPSLEEAVETGQVSDVILYSMCALGARFSHLVNPEDSSRRKQGAEYAEKAFKSLDLRDLSISTIQACILLGTISLSEGNMEEEAVFLSNANRMALILRLPTRECANEIERQVNLRVWWSLYMIDLWNAKGAGIPTQMKYECYPLPSEETYFLQSPLVSKLPFPTPPIGIWGEMARLAKIWSDIMELNETVIHNGLDIEQLYSAVDSLILTLDTWSQQLPNHLRETMENLEHYAAIGLGACFSALHMGHHYYNQVLLYQFLVIASEGSHSGTHEQILRAKGYAWRCKQHAIAFGDMLQACDEITGGNEAHFTMLGHLIMVTSTVHMHQILFDDPESDTTRIARNRLETNFAKLTEMQVYWKILDNSLIRLKTFHRACLMSIERSFRFDTWMLRFLQTYGVKVGDKFLETCETDLTVSLEPTAAETLQLATSSSSASSESSLQAWFAANFA